MTDDGRHSNLPDDGRAGDQDDATTRVPRPGEPGDPGSGPTDPPTGPVPTGSSDAPTQRTPGRMRQQDANTAPREPSLAERRARERKLESDREAVRVKDARSKKNKRILIGAGATVGVVALIAGIYAATSDDDEVEARCVGPDNVVVDDSNCQTPVAGGNYNGGGGFGFFPIFLGGGGRQYHYNYGGSGGIGQVATGGSTSTPPAGTSVRSGTSGGTSTISRGGLGVSSGGSKAGGGSSSSGGS